LSEFTAWLNAQVGVSESPPSSNHVKYWDMVYPQFQGQPWCLAMCIAGLRDVGFGKSEAPDIYSCTNLRAWAKARGLWVSSGYRAGDLIIFDFNGNPAAAEHVGVCMRADTKTVTCIEGNTSAAGSQDNGGAVLRKTRSLSLVLGAYRPPYAAESNDNDKGDDIVTQADFDKMMSVWLAARDKLGKADNRAPLEFDSAVAAGITDGTRPQAFATRQEVAVMCKRAAGVLW
jgi:hypothetical protein